MTSRRRTGKSKPAVHPASTSVASQLITSIRSNDLPLFSSLLATPKLDVNCRTPQGDLPFVESCRYARLEMATRLLALHANVNMASTNRRANRVGLTPLIAACMALETKIVALLLAQRQKRVSVLKTFGRVNAATVLLLFCVANGRTDEQNQVAVQLLAQLLTYAKQAHQVTEVLTAKPDRVNSVVHVAAGLGNWKALAMLREHAEEWNVDFGARNAAGHSLLRLVELNAFHARSLQFCEPPRPVAAMEHAKKGRRRRKKGREEKQEIERSEKGDESGKESPSEADKQTFTKSRPVRSVEAIHVTRTVLEVVNESEHGVVFARKGHDGVRGLYLKALVLAHVGLVSLVNEIARMPDRDDKKSVYLDGLMYTVTCLYPLTVKKAKEYRSLWHQALRTDSTRRQRDEESANNELGHEALQLILSGMLSYNSLSRRIKVWTVVLVHLLRPFDRALPLEADGKPKMAACSLLPLYERITKMLYRSGAKLAFSIFDRTDLEDDESYDEETEVHLFIALFELLLKLFTPYARTIRMEESQDPLGVTSSFQRAIQPVKQLWSLVTAALSSLDDVIATPQRFSTLLHLLQVFEQLEAAFVSDEEATLQKLFQIVDLFVKQEAKKKRNKTFPTEQMRLSYVIATTFPLPLSFTDKVIPFKASVDVLIRSDPKVLGMDLYSFASIPGLVRLEHKVDYLVTQAEDRSGLVSISISRTSEANYVDFILQQVLSASEKQLKGEVNVTLVNEPGIGVGVTREFFQIVQRCFFQPRATVDSHSRVSLPAPHVSKIGAQWLQLARSQNSQDERLDPPRHAKGDRGTQSFTDLFPFFDFVDEQKEETIAIASRPLCISKRVYDVKRSTKDLKLSRKEVLVNRAEVHALKKVYLCLGRLLGLAIRNHQPLGVAFPLVFWKFMLRDVSLVWEDYCEASQMFTNSLQFVLDHDLDVEPLDLRFEHTIKVLVVEDDAKVQEEAATRQATASGCAPILTSLEMELEEGQGDVQVTNANKAQYVLLRAQHFCFGNEVAYYKKMRDGLHDTIARSDLHLFRPEELQRLVRGEYTIDVASLKNHVVYLRGAQPSCSVVAHFWYVVERFDQAQCAQLLTFWSGSSRPPIFGFDYSKYRSLNTDTASWCLEVDTQMPKSFCPMANTCDRRLILPDYPTRTLLKEKLLVALELGSVGYDRM